MIYMVIITGPFLSYKARVFGYQKVACYSINVSALLHAILECWQLLLLKLVYGL